MWNYNKRGLKDAVSADFSTLTADPKQPLDQVQLDAVKALVASEIAGVSTNGVAVRITGDVKSHQRRINIEINPLDLVA